LPPCASFLKGSLKKNSMIIIKGVPASPGIAIGKAYVHEDEDLVVEKKILDKDKLKLEIKRFKDAVKQTNDDLDATEAKVLMMLGKQHAKLIEAHKLILRDPLITQEVARIINEQYVNAEYALSQTLEHVNRSFEKIDDEFFRERRHDLFDVGKRLIRHLTEKQERRTIAELSEPVILAAHNLYPSDTFKLRESKVLGFCTDIGGKTSHTALLAQSMEIPAVVGLSDITRQVKNDDILIIDGEQGLVIVNPGAEALEKYQKLRRKQIKEERFLDSVRNLSTVTRDGRKTNLYINLDASEDIANFVSLNPDGVGLVRTESVYMNRTAIPSEDEQLAIYRKIAEAYNSVPVTLRLADIGGDKLANLGVNLDKEQNPFMGLRGIRLLMQYPAIMKCQVRAIMRAAAGKTNVKVMIPMVSTLEEVCEVKSVITEISDELLKEGKQVPSCQLGIMVEVPSAALTLDTILSEIDFVSVGTNDLIQYILAVDRVNQHVAHLYDPYHPAVLRILNLIIQTAHKKGKPVSICGEMASDPKATYLLVGMGVDILSVTPRMFLKIKHTIRSMRFEQASQMAQSAMGMGTSAQVRELVSSTNDENP